jgi:hypothetical protein
LILIRRLHTTLRTRLTLLYVFLLCIVPLSYVAWTSVFLWRTLLGELDLSLDRDIETGLRQTYHTNCVLPLRRCAASGRSPYKTSGIRGITATSSAACWKKFIG